MDLAKQNKAAGLAMVLVAVAIAVLARRTPLELLMPGLDRKLVHKPVIEHDLTSEQDSA